MAVTLSTTRIESGLNLGTGATSDVPVLISTSLLVTVAVLMVRSEVTAGGYTDVVATPEIHIAVISNERGARKIAVEAFPGMHLPEATRTTGR